jgi:hypothetical protein
MAVDAHAAASAALWAFVKEANCGADMIPAHTFLSTHAVTASTKNFIVQSVTLSIGSTSCGYGGTVPLNMEDMEASPDLLIGYLPPRMAGKKVGHFVALLDVSMEVPLARVEKAETESFYTGVVSVGEGGAKYRVMDIGMYPWGLGRVGHTMDTSISTWAASLGVHALAKHTHATHMRTHSTHTHTHMYAHRSPGSPPREKLRTAALSLQCIVAYFTLAQIACSCGAMIRPAHLGEHGDLHGIKLKYMHPDNPIRQAFHGGTYLAYLRRYSDHSCTPLLATCHAQPPLFRLQENLTKRFPSYSILEAFCAVFDPLQLASAAALEPDYGLAELNLLLDHYGGVVAKGDLSRRIRLEWKTNEANPSAPAEMSCDGSAEDEEEEEENEEEIEYVRPFINVDRVLQEYPIFLRAVQEQVQHTSPPRISNTHPTSHQQRNHHLYRWASGSRTTPRTFPGDEQLTL